MTIRNFNHVLLLALWAAVASALTVQNVVLPRYDESVPDAKPPGHEPVPTAIITTRA